MDEKKLTDEEIVKMLGHKKEEILEECDRTGNSVDDYICCLDANVVVGVYDLIHRFQDENKRLKKQVKQGLKDMKLEVGIRDKEIERLTERLDYFQKSSDYHEGNQKELETKNAELQKKVDELTERYLEESKERCEYEQKYKKIQHAHNIGLGAQRSQWEKKVQQAVKDTAEKFAEMAKELLDKQEKGWSANMIWIITAKNCIDETCKKITGEKNG